MRFVGGPWLRRTGPSRSRIAGIATAEMMLHFEIGTLRTMPEPDHRLIR